MLFRDMVEAFLRVSAQVGALRVNLDPAFGARAVTAVVQGLTLEAVNAPLADSAELEARLEVALRVMIEPE